MRLIASLAGFLVGFVAPVAAEILSLEYPADFKNSGTSVLVVDINPTSGGTLASIVLKVGEKRDMILTPGISYTLTCRGWTNYARTAAAGSASTQTVTIAAGNASHLAVYLQGTTGIPAYVGPNDVTPTAGAASAGSSVLFITLTAGFVLAWLFFSPLDA